MKFAIASSLLALLHVARAVPDPLITPLAQLHARQDVDPALVGWVSASTFSDRRTCDFPATLSVSGSYAQCCSAGETCNFFTTCSAGTLFAPSASVFCDNGYCNTGVIVETAGASGGSSFLGCWATSLGEEAFTLIKDIGSAPIATPTGSVSSQSENQSSEGSQTSASRASRTSDAAESTTRSVAETTTASATGAATQVGFRPLTGMLGLVGGLLAVF